MSLLESLKTTRIKAGYSQTELADYAGITQITISNIERGVHHPTQSTRQKIERVLGSQVDWERTYDEGLVTS